MSPPPPARGTRTIKTVQLAENEVRALCLKSREIFLGQPILLELEAPLKICGEVEGAVCVCVCVCVCGAAVILTLMLLFVLVKL